MEKATFAAGCFWGVEDVFMKLPGVVRTRVGYTGGTVEHPTYSQVCAGDTGHKEAVEVVYDPESVRYEELLDVFWNIHDPTTRNRQGPDVGEQYHSVIFFHTDAQRTAAEKSKEALSVDAVTDISPASVFYEAERYHQQYYLRRGGTCGV